MADDARDLFNIEIDEFQKKAKVIISLILLHKTALAAAIVVSQFYANIKLSLYITVVCV